MTIKHCTLLTPTQVSGLYPKAFKAFENWFSLLDVSMKDLVTGTASENWDNTKFYLDESGAVYAARPDRFVMGWSNNENIWYVNDYTEFLHKEIINSAH
jgi:hypothetical protein